jgi:hypothetical protein
MKLRDLDARFIRYEDRIEKYEQVLGDPRTWKHGDPTETITGPRTYLVPVPTLAEAHGIVFDCPCATCRQPESFSQRVEATFLGRGVADDKGSHNKAGKPTRWVVVSGSGLDDLTLQPSIQIEDACKWHGFVTAGVAA